ncbi:predicted protein, partial [Nematostella vectensis]
KQARVTQIYKYGPKTDMDDYRPISVISVVAKLFERVGFNQLYSFFDSNELLVGQQSVFR